MEKLRRVLKRAFRVSSLIVINGNLLNGCNGKIFAETLVNPKTLIGGRVDVKACFLIPLAICGMVVFGLFVD